MGRIRSRLGALPLPVKIGAVVVAVGLIVGGLIATTGGPPTYTLTADFAETPGLYPGNFVDVLGIPVGHIIRVSPHANGVTVVMHVDSNIKVPANAKAFLMAPDVVNDRYVQLDPAYTTGAVMAHGAVIPITDTVDPVSTDQVFTELDQLARALGPNGANAHGAFSQLLHSAAKAFANDGPDIHNSISSFGQALSALSSDAPALTSLINNFGGLTHAAANATGTYESFANDLAIVSQSLDGDSTDIHAALANLQQALASIAQFVHTNGTALGVSVANLSKVAAAIGGQQQTLAQLLSVAPLTLQNVENAYNAGTKEAGHPALATRFDPVSGSASFASSVCGNSVLRLLVLAIDQSVYPQPGQKRTPAQTQSPQAETTDLGCGVAYATQTLPVPPGASSGPNMTLQSLLAASRS
jgi:phospholipid/cholesterol/gamma-HCH transport system substrate-binding protein